MDQQLKASARFSKKSAIKIGVISLCFIIACGWLLPHYFSKIKSNYTHRKLSLPKLTTEHTQNDAEDNKGWKTLTTKSGDTLGSLFHQVGLSQQMLHTVLLNNTYAKRLTNIKPNQQIELLIENDILEKLIVPLDVAQYLLVYRKDNHYFTKIKERAMDSHNEYITATIKGSLFRSAKAANVPFRLVQQMIDIFNWDIDFKKDVRDGDQFSIMYEAFYVDDSLVRTGNILAVSYTNRGVSHQAIRHVSANGDEDYFTPAGTSLKKAFSRYPLQFSHISSTFSLSRKHPVLHYNRPHKGVDLAAPIGTPIKATGDGRIETIGHQNDYGNMVKIVHNKTYSSLYGHLLKFQKGLSRGDFVKRGQVIGYVGQTGLATGPHCHYEFHVNHSPKNPTTIELPKAAPVSTRELASFRANVTSLLASLKLYEAGHLAAVTAKRTTDTG